MSPESDGEVERIEMAGEFDRHDVELFQLALRRLARQHGVEIRSIRAEKAKER